MQYIIIFLIHRRKKKPQNTFLSLSARAPSHFGTVSISEGLSNGLHRPQFDSEILKEGRRFIVPQQIEKLDVKINLQHFLNVSTEGRRPIVL